MVVVEVISWAEEAVLEVATLVEVGKETGLKVIAILLCCLIWTKIHKHLCCYTQGVMEEAEEGMEEMAMMDLVEMVSSPSR